VEDEDRLAKVLIQGLREEGHRVDLCTSGEQALSQARDIDYDAIILDWMLPAPDGVSVLPPWRDTRLRTPGLLLTARGSVGHRRGAGQLDLFRAGPVTVDGRRRVLVGPDGELGLTPREYALACELFGRAGEVLSRTHLLGAVWGANFDGDPNILDVYVGYLRGKLGRVAGQAVEIKAVRGVGYRLQVASEG